MAKLKHLTPAQARDRQHKAVLFLENVLGDYERAGEVAAEPVEEYIHRRHGTILPNPRRPARAAYSFAGSDVGWLILIFNRHGEVIREKWVPDRSALLDWVATHAPGVPLIHIPMAVEPDEQNPGPLPPVRCEYAYAPDEGQWLVLLLDTEDEVVEEVWLPSRTQVLRWLSSHHPDLLAEYVRLFREDENPYRFARRLLR